MSAREPQLCDGVNGEHAGAVRFYLTGWKCPAHSPWAEAGLPEPLPGPGLPHGARIPAPLSASALIDDRAVASGKRRSSPEAYRAAQAAVHHGH
jgi:hypothetical protein